MTNNRDLLKEAIADAKAVKETAIANAKAALEEAFTPYLKEKLAAKLSEMDEEEVDNDIMGVTFDEEVPTESTDEDVW
jgi:Arc/MetJ family transcription regulator